MSYADPDADAGDSILDLRIASVHASGRLLRWHVILWKHLTVADLLRTVVMRSQATDAKLKAGSVILVELLHGKLHRTFENSVTLERFRREDFLAVYEVPEQPGDAIGDGKFITVACHARFARHPSSSTFFEEGDEAYRDISGIPLVLRVREGVTCGCLYDMVRAGYYGLGYGGSLPSSCASEAGGLPTPFALFLCEQSRTLSTGGVRLDPNSAEPARLLCTDRNRKAVLLAAEWLEGEDPSPWALHDAGSLGPLSDLPECFMEAIIGVDVSDLCRQCQKLREDRRELLAEIDDLRKCLGRAVDRAEPPDSQLSSKVYDKSQESLLSEREIRRGRHPGQAPSTPGSRSGRGAPSSVYVEDTAGPAGLTSLDADAVRWSLMR